jgi:hypothetical protein
MIKLKRMRLARYVARMGEIKMHIIFWLENLNGRDNSLDLGQIKDNIGMDLRERGW